MPARLLALDSSTDCLAVAVANGAHEWTRTVAGGAQASSHIIALALEGLAESGLQVSQLDAVAFAAGPGAFTGLRCACAVAQGMAFAAARPVLAIDSLMIVAEAVRAGMSAGGELWVALDARMSEVYAGHYRLAADGARWQVLADPALYTLPALAARWRAAPPQAVAGNAPAAFGERLRVGSARVLAPVGERAAALLALARGAFADGAAMAPQQAAPLYLRDKVALTTVERDAARSAAAPAPSRS